MGNFRSFWLFGYEQWGDLRPAKMWDKNGKYFIPLIFGIWVRCK